MMGLSKVESKCILIYGILLLWIMIHVYYLIIHIKAFYL